MEMRTRFPWYVVLVFVVVLLGIFDNLINWYPTFEWTIILIAVLIFAVIAHMYENRTVVNNYYIHYHLLCIDDSDQPDFGDDMSAEGGPESESDQEGPEQEQAGAVSA